MNAAVLLPLRIETRFDGNRLRLRVIPDEPWFDRHDPLPSAAELASLERYRATTADQPPRAEAEAAWRAFAEQHGPGRATWLVRTFGAPQLDRGTALREGVRFTRLAGLPSRLEVWLVRRGGDRERIAVLPVRPELLRLDPGDPDVPAERRWWESWVVAVRAGLAIEVELDADPGTIDAIHVVGLSDGDPSALFASHRDAGQLGLLAPGTPTNTVAGAPAADLAEDPMPWLALQRRGPNLQEQQLSVALTGDAELLGPLPGDGRPHQRWARQLAAGLWPALWGHPLGDIHNLGADVEDLAAWAERNLEPLGPYPILRVGSQPYGLLPATALADWKPARDDPPIEERMRPTLLALRTRWERAAVRAGRGTVEGADAERLVDLLAQPPASPGYAVRVMHPLELWLLALLATDHAVRWPQLLTEWERVHPLAAEIRLQPRRRYAARGRAGRMTLPLVTPSVLPAGQTAGTILTSLVELAQTRPRTFAETADVETAIGVSTNSLLLRLAIRSLQVALGDIGRRKRGIPRGTLEPIAARPTIAPLLSQWIQAVGPADLDAETGPAIGFRRAVDGLRAVAAVPAGDLERLLPATIDCASHRLDAWLTGPARRRLRDTLDQQPRLGAYGWVEHPNRGNPGPTAGGLLLAPSAPQALTAAILRDRAVDDPEPARWHMDITSDRARRASRLADEVRRGAHPAETLGREVERVVGDPARIRALRLRFPIHPEDAGRRVCDGQRALAAPPDSLNLPAHTLAELAPLRAAVDVYGDLLVAEAVHHVVEGRAAVAGAALDAAAGLGRPPVLDVLNTRHEGRPVETSCAVVLPDAAPPPVPTDPAQRAAIRPALLAEPAVAALLRARLGGPAAWRWIVTRAGAPPVTVTLAALGLEPADALALALADLERLALTTAGGTAPTITDRDGSLRYEHAARLVALIGRTPAGPADVAERDAGPDASPVEADMRERLASLRAVAAALGTVLDAARGGTATDRRAALRLAARWGIAPAPDPADADPLLAQTDRARHQLAERLAAAPDTATAATLDRPRLADAIAALASPTGQIAVCSRLRRGALPELTAAPTDGGGLDDAWLPFVAPVRPPLARLEAFQLTAGTTAGSGPGLVPWTNRPADPWQRDAGDARRLVAVYAPRGLNLRATAPETRLAAALLDRFAETIPDGERTAAAAIGFHAPAARAPQAILLAVPPDPDRPLDGETLVRIVEDTRILARARMAMLSDLGDVAGVLPLPVLPATGPTAGRLDPPIG